MAKQGYAKEPHNHRSLKGATMRVLRTRANRRRAKQHARQLERIVTNGR